MQLSNHSRTAATMFGGVTLQDVMIVKCFTTNILGVVLLYIINHPSRHIQFHFERMQSDDLIRCLWHLLMVQFVSGTERAETAPVKVFLCSVYVHLEDLI